MINQSFINSMTNKINRLFLNKKITSVITLYDQSNCIVNNALHFALVNGCIGIFKNGPNPIFSDIFFSDFDTFNLYENYDVINSRLENIDYFVINEVNLFFNQDYNELIAFDLIDRAKNS